MYHHNTAIREAAEEIAFELGLNQGEAAAPELVALRTVAASLIRSGVIGLPYVVARRVEESYLEGVSLFEAAGA